MINLKKLHTANDGHSIFTGAGTGMVVLNYIKYKPEFVNLTVIQTDLLLYNKKI
jgi:hypothetical protein